MIEPRPFRCADAARARSDPQLGTAPQARRWLLVEHPGPWRVDALAGSGIATDVQQLLTRAAQAASARLLLVRRPGRSAAKPYHAWAVTSVIGSTVWGTWSTDDDLRVAAEVLTAPSPPDVGAAEPLILVCTHGVHDACCAIRGRPVAAALSQRWPELTWECSHVGGDRFAANVVVLPDGVYYGNLDAQSAVSTVAAHLGGQLRTENLRGFSSHPPAVQAAMAAVHERLGPFGPRDVAVGTVTRTPDGHWQIDLSVAQAGFGRVQVRVSTTRRSLARLTCRAASGTPATTYQIVDLRQEP